MTFLRQMVELVRAAGDLLVARLVALPCRLGAAHDYRPGTVFCLRCGEYRRFEGLPAAEQAELRALAADMAVAAPCSLEVALVRICMAASIVPPTEGES